MPTELEDEALWPDDRIAAAEAQIAAEKQRRAAAKEAANPPPPPDFNNLSDQELRNMCAEGDRAKRVQREAERRAMLEAQQVNRYGGGA
jgi:hypothetical protein